MTPEQMNFDELLETLRALGNIASLLRFIMERNAEKRAELTKPPADALKD